MNETGKERLRIKALGEESVGDIQNSDVLAFISSFIYQRTISRRHKNIV